MEEALNHARHGQSVLWQEKVNGICDSSSPMLELQCLRVIGTLQSWMPYSKSLLFSGVENKVEHGRLWEALAGGQVQAYGGTVHVNNRLLHHQNSHMEKVSFVTLDRPGMSNCKMLKQDNSDCSCYKFAKVLCHWEGSRTESLLPIS